MLAAACFLLAAAVVLARRSVALGDSQAGNTPRIEHWMIVLALILLIAATPGGCQ